MNNPEYSIKAFPRFAICGVAKLENAYIDDWLEYYYKIGAALIILADNNDMGGEKICDCKMCKRHTMLGDLIIMDYRGIRAKNIQMMVYQKAYNEYKEMFDWMGFFDIDEFLYTGNRSILSILSQPEIRKHDIICVSEVIYSDNGLIERDPRPVIRRFTVPSEKASQYKIAQIIKCIVKSGANNIDWVGADNPHLPLKRIDITAGKCITLAGKEPIFTEETQGINQIFQYSIYMRQTTEIGFIKHFIQKTIREFLYNKCEKGWPEGSSPVGEIAHAAETFFLFNEWSPEKQKVVNEYVRKLQAGN